MYTDGGMFPAGLIRHHFYPSNWLGHSHFIRRAHGAVQAGLFVRQWRVSCGSVLVGFKDAAVVIGSWMMLLSLHPSSSAHSQWGRIRCAYAAVLGDVPCRSSASGPWWWLLLDAFGRRRPM
jgi:hypothetical protein